MSCEHCGAAKVEVHLTAIGKARARLCDNCRKALLPSFGYGEREPPERGGETLDHYPPEGRFRNVPHHARPDFLEDSHILAGALAPRHAFNNRRNGRIW